MQDKKSDGLDTLLDQGRTYHRNGEHIKAEAIYRRILAQEPTHHRAHYLLAAIDSKAKGQHTSAIVRVLRSLRLKPDCLEAAAYLEELYCLTGQGDQAATVGQAIDVLRQNRLFVFGDSHSSSFSRIPFVDVQWLGPVTMHRIGRDGLNILDVRRYGLLPGNPALFIFGEIDVRAHLVRQSEIQGVEPRQLIDRMVAAYGRVLDRNRSNLPSLKVIVSSVVPPSDAHPSRHGSLEQRIVLTRMLNDALENMCQSMGFVFLDVYSALCGRDGAMPSANTSDGIHVNPEIMVKITEKFFSREYELIIEILRMF